MSERENLKESVEKLIRGESIISPMEEQIVFNRLGQGVEEVWSLLLAAGYLKVTGYFRTEEMEEYEKSLYVLTLTNQEVRQMFHDMIKRWFGSDRTSYNSFIKDLLTCDLDYMNEYMNELSLQLFSSFDTGNHPSGKARPERFYHGFVLGLMVELRSKYIITSNKESGFGRYDVILEPRNKEQPAFILEFKVLQPGKEEILLETVVAALKQIEEKKYAAELIERGVPQKNIHSFGFVFRGKEVLIGKA